MLGNDDGPLVFQDELFARVALTVAYYRFARRFVIKPYTGHGRHRDNHKPTMSSKQAWRVATGEQTEYQARRVRYTQLDGGEI